MSRGISWWLLLFLVGCATSQSAAPAPTSGLLQFDGSTIAFKPAPGMPPGVELAVLEGDPKGGGLFTVRLRVPAGFSLPPHTHPVAERVIVISGEMAVGFGPEVLRERARRFTAGAFYVNPPGMPHYVFSETGGTLQVTGVGPWRVDFLAPR